MKTHSSTENSRFLRTRRQVGLFHPDTFSLYSYQALVAYCLVASLSIVLSQIILCSLLLYWLCFMLRSGAFGQSSSRLFQSYWQSQLTAAIASWILLSFLAALVGVDTPKGLIESLKTAVYLLIPFCVLTSFTVSELSRTEFTTRIKMLLFALVVSQSVASVHSILTNAIGSPILPKLPGTVTESGQLVLVIPAALALLAVTALQGNKSTEQDLFCSTTVFQKLCAVGLFICLISLAWPNLLPDSLPITQSICILFSLLLSVAVLRSNERSRHKKEKKTPAVLLITLCLLFAALILNLKRGPWLGVTGELIILGFCLSKRLVIATLLIVLLFSSSIAPVHSRLFQFADHFSMSGGRQTMWGLGVELLERHPLGLGLDNAEFMREIDPTLPSSHRHMHNNFLNIAVETGWMGLFVYLWWMFIVISMGFSIWKRTHDPALGLFAITTSSALLGWQTAGFFEYNFGDGEVRLIAFFFMGLLLAIARFLRLPRQETSP